MRFSPYSNQLQRYYEQFVQKVTAQRKEELKAVNTAEKAQAYVKLARERIRQAFGPLPERFIKSPTITDTIERNGIRLEKVIFECAPGFHLTGNFYRPIHLDGKAPGVLALLGHNDNGNAAINHQTFCFNLALKGAVIFSPEPIGQGERKQYLGNSLRKGCTWEHNMAGKQLQLCGEFFGAWRVADAKVALDYLVSRPETDTTRLAATGASGGGTLSSYIFALDERLSMVAPACYLTTFRRNFENELPTDAEQIPPGMWATGGDMADFLIARAPQPALILAVKNDFFDPRGSRECFEEARHIYQLLGAESELKLDILPGDHGYKQPLRQSMYGFFTKHWFGKADSSEPPFSPLSETEIQTTKTGQVADLPRETTWPQYLAHQAKKLAQNRMSSPDQIQAFLRQKLQVTALPPAPEYRILRGTWGESPLANIALRVEPESEAFLHWRGAQYHFSIPPAQPGTLYISHLDAETELLAGLPEETDHNLIFALEVRGVGKSAPQTCDRYRDYFDVYDSDYFYDATGQLLSQSFLGGKVRDVLSAWSLLQQAGFQDITLAGSGLGALVAIYTAGTGLISPKRIQLRNMPNSWIELMQSGVFLWPQSHLIPGMLKKFDLPDLARMLAETSEISITDPWDGLFQPVTK